MCDNVNFLIFMSVTLTALPTVLGFIFVIRGHCAWIKRAQSVKDEFDLVEGQAYDVLQNGGRTTSNLTFIKIYRGNNSANGNINLLFTKRASYQGGTIEREVVIKYGSIWNVTKL